MQTPDDYRLLMIGLPASGKTSFLAALWHLAESHLQDMCWHQYKYGPDIEYMNRIRRRWLDCQPQDRTIQESVGSRKIDLFLENTTGRRVTINVPDIAGEQFAQQWSTRIWSKDYDQLARSAHGLLLFINPNSVRPPVHLVDTTILKGTFIEASDEPVEEINWDPALAPSQVISVDLLQFHLPILADPNLASAAVIISAWDTVLEEDDEITPNEWLGQNVPLLNQYLNANEDTVRFAVFGVSAQGGDYGRPEIQHTLIEEEEPTQRVIVQEKATQHHNLMAPIEWSMQTRG